MVDWQDSRATGDRVHHRAELLGSLLAAAVLLSIFDRSVWDPVHLGTPALAAGVGGQLGTWIEIVLTFFLLFSILGTAVYAKSPIQIGGFGVGLTIFADILVGGPLTGASMNPARSFGPAIMSGFLADHWVYWVGPIIGALIATNLYYYAIVDPEGAKTTTRIETRACPRLYGGESQNSRLFATFGVFSTHRTIQGVVTVSYGSGGQQMLTLNGTGQ